MFRLSRLALSSSKRAGTCRQFGAKKGPAGPYDIPHKASYPTEAFFGGSKEHKFEGWEYITVFTYIVSFGVVYFGLNTNGLDRFREWARREADARAVIKENGGEIEFGKFYQVAEYTEEDVDTMPALKEAEQSNSVKEAEQSDNVKEVQEEEEEEEVEEVVDEESEEEEGEAEQSIIVKQFVIASPPGHQLDGVSLFSFGDFRMAGTPITIDSDFGYVMITGSLIAMEGIFMGSGIMGLRKEFFASEKFKEELKKSGIEEEHKKAFPDQPQGPLLGYPDMGSGRYSALLPYKQWVEFNNAQRAHHNFLEQLPSVLMLQVLAGLHKPKATASLGVAYFFARILYARGYKGPKGAKGRELGAIGGILSLFSMFLLAMHGGVVKALVR